MIFYRALLYQALGKITLQLYPLAIDAAIFLVCNAIVFSVFTAWAASGAAGFRWDCRRVHEVTTFALDRVGIDIPRKARHINRPSSSRCTPYLLASPCSGLRPETPTPTPEIVMTSRSGSEARKKIRHIMVRIAPDELEAIQGKARDNELSVPAYMRACGMARQTRSKMEEHVLNELRRLGGLQKQLFAEGKGIGTPEYSACLAELKAAIRQAGSLIKVGSF